MKNERICALVLSCDMRQVKSPDVEHKKHMESALLISVHAISFQAQRKSTLSSNVALLH
jgi:hypothetical protein